MSALVPRAGARGTGLMALALRGGGAAAPSGKRSAIHESGARGTGDGVTNGGRQKALSYAILLKVLSNFVLLDIRFSFMAIQ